MSSFACTPVPSLDAGRAVKSAERQGRYTHDQLAAVQKKRRAAYMNGFWPGPCKASGPIMSCAERLWGKWLHATLTLSCH